MEIEFNLFGPLRELTDRKTVTRELPAGTTVGEALADLVDAYPGLEGVLATADGDLSGGVNLTKNGTNVNHLDGEATTLADGDVLRAAPPVVGGAR